MSSSQELVDALTNEPIAAEVGFDFIAVGFGIAEQVLGGLTCFLDGIHDGAREDQSVRVKWKGHEVVVGLVCTKYGA